MFIVAPTYRFAGSVAKISGPGMIRRATEFPLFENRPPVLPGTLLEFTEPNQEHTVDVPVPRLPGLDDLEVEQVAFDLSSARDEETAEVVGSPAGDGTVALTLATTGPNVVARLNRIELDDVRIPASTALGYIIAASGASGTLGQLAYVVDAESGETRAVANGTAPLADWVHLVVRTGAGSRVGPPIAAAPSFAMPGAGKDMYGPALGSAYLVVTQSTNGEVQIVMHLIPAPLGTEFSLLLGRASQVGPNEGLPTDVSAVPWSARTVRAVFDRRPGGIKIEASTTSLSQEHPLVAEFPTDPGDTPVTVDLAPAARSLLRRSYPLAQGADLGLQLRLTAGTPGILRVNLGPARARYLHYPLEHGPLPQVLRGAPEPVDLVVPAGLRPSALSFTVDGIYGPARLTLDSDTAVPEARHGFRIANAVQMARRVSLTTTEAHLAMARIAVFGRASETSEVLFSLHAGDTVRVGPRVSEPLSLNLEPEATPRWHRVEFPRPGLLPPHPELLWLVVRATRGVFWWHGPLEPAGTTSRSIDDGGTFVDVSGRPQAQVAVLEVDSTTQFPAPLQPLSLSWEEGLLNGDLVGVEGGTASLPPDFRRFWIAGGEEHRAFLDRIASLAGKLRLTFSCARDVDLSLSEVVLTYDPWQATQSSP